MANRYKYLPVPATGKAAYIDADSEAAADSAVGGGNYDSTYGFVLLGATQSPSQQIADFFKSVTSTIDAQNKTITLQFKSESGAVLDTDTIDISPMFSGGPAPSAASVHSGFSATNTLTAQNVTDRTDFSQSVATVSGLDVTLQRNEGAPKYMFFWSPDSLGAITGFKFSGTFVDVWQSVPLTVDGEAGKLYVSDNPTHAQHVEFEVEA
jgi:hypothetical protein